MSLIDRIAAELGWTHNEVQSFSLPAIRVLVSLPLQLELSRIIQRRGSLYYTDYNYAD